MADLLFSAATDHRYLDQGHILDFTNKALEALDVAGWSHAEVVLSSLAEGYVARGAWRSPTPGAIPWIWYRYSRTPSSSCPTL